MTRWLAIALDYPPSKGGIQTYLHALFSRLPAGTVDLVVPARAAAAAATPAAARVPACVTGNAVVAPPGVGSGEAWAAACGAAAGAIEAETSRPPWTRIPALAARAMLRLHSGGHDGILCGHATLAPLAIVLSALARIPTVAFAYGSELTSGRARPFCLAALGASRHVVAVSEATRVVLLERGVDPRRIQVITPGVDSLGRPAREPDERDWPIPGHPRLITCARLASTERYKGHDRVLESMARCAGPMSGASYVVAGEGDDRPRLEALARRLGLASRVHFAGRVARARLEALLDRADIYVMPSDARVDAVGRQFEGFGIAYLEAALHGLPAIAGRAGGAPEAVLDGRTGILVDPADPAALDRALMRLAGDEGLRRALGDAARIRARVAFRWEDRALALGTLLEAIASQSSSRTRTQSFAMARPARVSERPGVA